MIATQHQIQLNLPAWLIVAAVVLVLLAGWVYTVNQSATSLGQHAAVEVRVVDFAFEPATITVSPGTTVAWTNVGPTAHTTTSRQRIWDSGILEKGAVYRYTFNQQGVYDYWCTHASQHVRDRDR